MILGIRENQDRKFQTTVWGVGWGLYPHTFSKGDNLNISSHTFDSKIKCVVFEGFHGEYRNESLFAITLCILS